MQSNHVPWFCWNTLAKNVMSNPAFIKSYHLTSLTKQVLKMEQLLSESKEQFMEVEFCKKLAKLFKWVLSFKWLLYVSLFRIYACSFTVLAYLQSFKWSCWKTCCKVDWGFDLLSLLWTTAVITWSFFCWMDVFLIPLPFCILDSELVSPESATGHP